MELYKKLFKIQGMNLTFTKSADNPYFRSKYVPLENIQQKLNPILQQEGLLVYHKIYEKQVVTYILDVEDGDLKFESSYFLIPENLDAQKMGAAITYGKRYNLVALFNLILVGEDDDGNSAVDELDAKAKKETKEHFYEATYGKKEKKLKANDDF